MAKITHKDPTTTGLGWQGQNFEADANGVFDVPDEALTELCGIGFSPVPEPGEGNEHMVKLAGLKKAELVEHAKLAYGVDLDPEDKKDALLEQILALAAKAADEEGA